MGSVFPYECQSFPFTKADLGGPEGIVRLKNVKVSSVSSIRECVRSHSHLSTYLHNMHMFICKCLKWACTIYTGRQICGLVLHHTESPGCNHVIHSGANKYQAHFTPRFTSMLMILETLSIPAMCCMSRKKSLGLVDPSAVSFTAYLRGGIGRRVKL